MRSPVLQMQNTGLWTPSSTSPGQTRLPSVVAPQGRSVSLAAVAPEFDLALRRAVQVELAAERTQQKEVQKEQERRVEAQERAKPKRQAAVFGSD